MDLQLVMGDAPEANIANSSSDHCAGDEFGFVTEDDGQEKNAAENLRCGRTAARMKCGMVSRSVIVPSKSKSVRSIC
jgi:hypothetical protein